MTSLIPTAAKYLDILLAALLAVIFIGIDHKRRSKLSKKAAKELSDVANSPRELLLAANTAASVTQGLFALGGILFAGLFAAVFQQWAALKPHGTDLVLAFIQIGFSLLVGISNVVFVQPKGFFINIRFYQPWVILVILQSCALLGGLARMVIVVIKYLQ